MIFPCVHGYLLCAAVPLLPTPLGRGGKYLSSCIDKQLNTIGHRRKHGVYPNTETHILSLLQQIDALVFIPTNNVIRFCRISPDRSRTRNPPTASNSDIVALWQAITYAEDAAGAGAADPKSKLNGSAAAGAGPGAAAAGFGALPSFSLHTYHMHGNGFQ